MTRRKAEDVIPDDTMEAARAAGLKAPLWYVGRRKGTPRPRGKTLTDIVREARRDAGLCADCYRPHSVGEPHTGGDRA